MDLTIEEAATRLGVTVRQVRYLIQQGKLESRKAAGRWFIDSDSLPLAQGQAAAQARKASALRDAVEEALAPAPDKAQRYSVRNLKAFQVALPIHAKARAVLGEDHVATCALRLVLEHLARGCHRYDREEKSASYRAARDEASRAVCEMVLIGSAPADELVHAVEQDLMAALAGLLRRVDRHRFR